MEGQSFWYYDNDRIYDKLSLLLPQYEEVKGVGVRRLAEGWTPRFLAYRYYHSTRRWRDLALASRGGTNAATFGIPILWILSRRWRLQRGKCRNFWYYNIDQILSQYEEVKGVGVGVSQRDKRHDFWYYNINWIFSITILTKFMIRRCKTEVHNFPFLAFW